MYFVYVLKSVNDLKHYVGTTADLERRIKEHNAGKVSSTKHRRPFELVYSESFYNRGQAEKRERYFKTGKGRVTLRICMTK
ncbi:MAG: GIY-YIG nuclease family protein [Deltaproteobacteria bacterium]|nr:GIY-YIG nuclease family protein [Deltaproteobacteria bacterium]